VAGFLVEGYKALVPDPADDVPLLLSQIGIGLSKLSNGSRFTFSPPPPFQRSRAVPFYNGLWFFSLALSLVCALAATLIKQLGRNYLEQIRSEPKTSGRAFKRERFFQGIEKLHMKVWIDATVLTLHLAVLFFFMGLVVFVWSKHRGIAYSLLAFTALMFTVYTWVSISPPIRGNLPNITPVTSLMLIRVFHLMVSFSVGIKRGRLPNLTSITGLLTNRFIRVIDPILPMPHRITRVTHLLRLYWIVQSIFSIPAMLHRITCPMHPMLRKVTRLIPLVFARTKSFLIDLLLTFIYGSEGDRQATPAVTPSRALSRMIPLLQHDSYWDAVLDSLLIDLNHPMP